MADNFHFDMLGVPLYQALGTDPSSTNFSEFHLPEVMD